MKRISILILVTLAAVGMAAAQQQNGGKRPSFEQFLKDKTAFIVHEMRLPEKDSAAFVPLYIELQQKKGELFQRHSPASRRLRQQLKGGGSDVDGALYIEAVESEAQMNVDDALLEQEYIAKFKQVLSPRQLYDYMRAEKKFKSRFMNPQKGKK